MSITPTIVTAFSARPRYSGQHPAESVLDAIMSTTTREFRLNPDLSHQLAVQYFDARERLLLRHTASDRVFRFSAMLDLKKQIDALTANLDPDEGWPLSKADVRDRLQGLKETFDLIWEV